MPAMLSSNTRSAGFSAARTGPAMNAEAARIAARRTARGNGMTSPQWWWLAGLTPARTVPMIGNSCDSTITTRPLRLPLLRAPMPLEIGDESRAEMARGLLAGIDRHVAAEGVERLLADAEGAAVAGGADDAGAGEGVDDARERRIHRLGRRDLVADEAALGAVAFEAA